MPVIEMGEIVTDERETNKSQKKTGKQVTVTTLKDVEKIRELADAIHARGGKVVGTCVVNNPWLLDKLEPYCDAILVNFASVTERTGGRHQRRLCPHRQAEPDHGVRPRRHRHHRAGDRRRGA